jgi:hypothetical protein
MFDVTDTWPMLTVKNHGSPAEDVITTPAESPFRGRLFECRSLAVAWDLLNGRFVRRPPLHRMPPPTFESKQHQRLDGLMAWMHRGCDGKLRRHLCEQRKRRLRSEQEPQYWWGTHARMRIPARTGMRSLNRRAGYSVDRFIKWKPGI